MKVYLSGPISEVSDYRNNFNNASIRLKKVGYTVVNPCNLLHLHNQSYESYMREDLKALLDCDSIYMLDGWENSKGAQFELKTANICGIKRILN